MEYIAPHLKEGVVAQLEDLGSANKGPILGVTIELKKWKQQDYLVWKRNK